MDFAHYFYYQMPSVLTRYLQLTANRERKPTECLHHGIPASRACELWNPVNPLFMNKYFWYAWYFVNILDQNIHHSFNDRYDQYLRSIGSHYPIPMQGDAGFGCWRRVPPAFILSNISYDEAEWSGACRFFIRECENKLPAIAQIAPADFFRALLQDREFNSPEVYGLPPVAQRHERKFAELIRARYF